jgi:transmembrane sensor
MIHNNRWFRWVRRGGHVSDAPLNDAVDKALAHDVATVSAQEPDTTAQWNLLRARMARLSYGVSTHRPEPAHAWRKPASAIALGAAALILVAALFWFQQPVPLKYSTGNGQRSMVLLADSSEVTLNHNSELTVFRRGTKEGRRALLTGEAFFLVRNTGVPFLVNTECGSVQVLGTEFNIRVRRDEMEVAVVKGRVRVTASWEGKDSTVFVQGGEYTQVAKGRFPGSPQRLPSMTDYPGWVHGKFLFDHTPLASACLEIADQFGVPIAIGNQALRNETITGVVDGQTVEAAVKTLCMLTGASYRNESNGYLLF